MSTTLTEACFSQGTFCKFQLLKIGSRSSRNMKVLPKLISGPQSICLRDVYVRVSPEETIFNDREISAHISRLIVPGGLGCHVLVQGCALICRDQGKEWKPKAFLSQRFWEFGQSGLFWYLDPKVWDGLFYPNGIAWRRVLSDFSLYMIALFSWILASLLLIYSAAVNLVFPSSIIHLKWIFTALYKALIASLWWKNGW